MCLLVNRSEKYELIDQVLEARHNNNKEIEVEVEKVLVSDFLADVTQRTRKAFKLLVTANKIFKKSIYYK